MEKREYSKEFKEEVVNYAKTSGISRNQVSKKFGIPNTTLHGWLKATEKHKGEAFIGTGHLRSDVAKEKAREKELRDLKEENEILKKALAIFSKL